MRNINLSQRKVFSQAFFTFLLAWFIIGCQQQKETAQTNEPPMFREVSLKYAKGFKIHNSSTYTRIEVLKPYQGATKGYSYLLVPRGQDVPDDTQGAKVIRTPVRSIVCTSTTHIPLLDYLDESDKLVGFPSCNYISTKKTRQYIKEGKVQELGVDQGMNLEKLAVLKPDVLVGYTMTPDYGQFKKIEELGIPVILNAEYLEPHPLGRAEWIKFMAIFFGKENLADSIFQSIEKNYLRTKSRLLQIQDKPTILSGIMYGDAWFLPGGKNYASTMLQDAACNYLWQDDLSSGYLELSFESVYKKAHDADLWIGVGTFSSLKELAAGDHRYEKFKAFRNRQIYAYDARIGETGGNEFLELGYLRPDLILNDLVKIAHPEVLPGHSLFFHRKLN